MVRMNPRGDMVGIGGICEKRNIDNVGPIGSKAGEGTEFQDHHFTVSSF